MPNHAESNVRFGLVDHETRASPVAVHSLEAGPSLRWGDGVGEQKQSDE